MYADVSFIKEIKKIINIKFFSKFIKFKLKKKQPNNKINILFNLNFKKLIKNKIKETNIKKINFKLSKKNK